MQLELFNKQSPHPPVEVPKALRGAYESLTDEWQGLAHLAGSESEYVELCRLGLADWDVFRHIDHETGDHLGDEDILRRSRLHAPHKQP